MTEVRDRIVDMNPKLVSRYTPTELPYIWHIREKFHLDGRIELIHCWIVDDFGIRGK